ncbi:neutral/alkaline non-lysosomal ceramidase N-terminal domain-containing protein [Endozoicomonas lisbonensis]
MSKTKVLSSCIAFLLICQVICQNAHAWRAGFSNQSFPYTEHPETSDKAACMAGYGMLCWRHATGSHDSVGVQALFLTDEVNDSLVFISLDAIGFSQTLAKTVRERLSTETLLAKENILLTATHTHSSIDLQGLWGGLNEQQEQAIAEAIVETAKNAWGKTQKVSLHTATSNGLKGFNRRTKNNDIIPQILTIQLLNDQNKPFVTVFTLGSHPVVLGKDNTRLSSDWVHYARTKLTEQQGSPAMFINGTLGDVLPGQDNPRTFAYAETYGTEIAGLIINSLKNSEPLESSLKYCTETIEDKADNYSLIMATKALRNGTVDWNDPFSKSYRTRASVIALGKVVFLTTPGEPVTSMGRLLMRLVEHNPVAVLGLTHDSMGYLIPDKETKEDGNEERLMISHTLSGKIFKSLQHLVSKCLIQPD